MADVLTRVALSLGSNLGDRRFYIDAMERELLSALVGVRSSRLMETEPVGVGGGHPAYLNKVLVGYYGGDAYGLLESCLSIESRLGRVRPAGPKAPRTADADILLFGEEEITAPPRLVVPHPELLNRRFCLEGLMCVDSSIAVPVSGRLRTVGELYENMGAGAAGQNVFFLS